MKKIRLFEDRAFYAGLFSIALPIMLQNFVNSLVNVADTVMIGRLGTVEIAGVGLGNQVFFFFNILLFGIVSGGGVFTAQYWGKRDLSGIRKTLGLCLSLSLLLALAFMAACFFAPRFVIGLYSNDPAVVRTGSEYLKTLSLSFVPFAVSFAFTIMLRTVEKVRLAMTATVISLSVNVFLNWAFIFGLGPIPAMGVTGAAVATLIARALEALIIVAVTYAKRYPPAASARELFAFDAAFAKGFFAVALPVMANEFLWSFGITLQSAIFARTHTNAIAAFNITNTVSSLAWVVFIGLGNGVAVMIGKKIGEGDHARAREYAARITRFAPLLAAAVALVLVPASRLLPAFFRVDAAVFATANAMFVILACTYPFRAFNMSMVIGVCRAGGDTRFCAVYDVLFLWVLALPLAAFTSFVLGAPAWVVYAAVVTEEPFKALLGWWRLRSGKWLHCVV